MYLNQNRLFLCCSGKEFSISETQSFLMLIKAKLLLCPAVRSTEKNYILSHTFTLKSMLKHNRHHFVKANHETKPTISRSEYIILLQDYSIIKFTA